MIGFLLGFILCFILLYVFSSYFVEVPLSPTYHNSNVDTRVVCDYLGEYHNRLEYSISDLDDKLDDLLIKYSYLERRLFEPDYISDNTALSYPLEKVLVEILKDIEEIKNNSK